MSAIVNKHKKNAIHLFLGFPAIIIGVEAAADEDALALEDAELLTKTSHT